MLIESIVEFFDWGFFYIKVFTIEINNINMVITSLMNIEKSRLLLLPTMETTAFITINPLYLFPNYHNHTFLRHHHHQFDNGYQHSCHVHRLYHIHFSNNINCYNGQPPVYSILRIFCTVMTQCSHFISYLTKKWKHVLSVSIHSKCITKLTIPNFHSNKTS